MYRLALVKRVASIHCPLCDTEIKLLQNAKTKLDSVCIGLLAGRYKVTSRQLPLAQYAARCKLVAFLATLERQESD
jgi:hypothetical protein